MATELNLENEPQARPVPVIAVGKAEPFDPNRDREGTRGDLARGLLWLLTFAIGGVLAFIGLGRLEGTVLTQSIFPSLIALAGTALGFYFGSQGPGPSAGQGGSGPAEDAQPVPPVSSSSNGGGSGGGGATQGGTNDRSRQPGSGAGSEPSGGQSSVGSSASAASGSEGQSGPGSGAQSDSGSGASPGFGSRDQTASGSGGQSTSGAASGSV